MHQVPVKDDRKYFSWIFVTRHSLHITRNDLMYVTLHSDFTADTSINPLQAVVAFLYSLKTSENLKGFLFSGDIEKQHRAVMG